MPKSKLLLIALIIVFPFFLSACTLGDLPVIGKYLGGKNSGNGYPTDPVKISMWGLWESPEVMDVLIQKYQQQHPNVTIEYDDRSVIKTDEYKSSVYNRISQEGGVGDIVMVHNSWVPGLKNSLSPAKGIDANGFSQKFYPAATQSSVIEGNVYGIPLYYDGLVLVYNKKHFAEIDQDTPPIAWEEFRKLALDLTVRNTNSSITRAGAAIGTADNIDFHSDILGLMFSQAKVSMPDGLDSKAAEDAVSFYVNFVLEDKVWSSEFPEASSAFAQEKVSMIIVPVWNLLDILRVRPDLDIGVAPVPQAIPEDPASWGTFWEAVVPTTSKNQVVAWDFLNFLTQDEQQLMLFNEASKYREYGSPYSVTSLKSELDSNDFLRPLLETASFSKTGILAARAGNKGANDSIKVVVNTALKRGNISDALKDAKAIFLQVK